ncbi:hypothetical protein V9T40_002801 [Parthenolecanium corni]|uniref:Uncharacterized protein n=1 Tax=Parthenolecanium corni TaxID=536013 RepID=A0AAN9TLE7_9HEMI
MQEGMRDIQAVWTKFKHVLQPKEKRSLLKECKYHETSISVELFRRK